MLQIIDWRQYTLVTDWSQEDWRENQDVKWVLFLYVIQNNNQHLTKLNTIQNKYPFYEIRPKQISFGSFSAFKLVIKQNGPPFAIKTKALHSSVQRQPCYFDRQLLQRLPIPTKQPLTTFPIMPWGADNTRLADLFNAGPLNTLLCGQTQHSNRQKELVCLFQCEWGCFGCSWYIIKTAATLHAPMLWKEALWNLYLSVRGVYNATGEICGVQKDAAHTRLSINSIAPMHLSVKTRLININLNADAVELPG